MKQTTKQLVRISLSAAIFSLCIFSSTTLSAQQGNLINAKKMADEGIKSMSLTFPQKPEDISPLLIGETIPSATLKGANGESFDLNKEVAAKPTILIFYRGGWCPFCSKQLSGLQNAIPELEKQGYQLIAISTDKPEGLMQSTTKEKLSYTLLSDSDLNLAKQFGIAFKAPEGYWEMLPKTTGGMNKELLLPVPSIFILDQKGAIRFEYINPDFKQRISTALLTAVAQRIKEEL
ncbi:hypothetical protein PBAL39_16239 [Pedobacter sp. BAL39]|uniref:peroxiredoxin family protein n=1 Tax=Pedobacter sp. BAL39 TaxID=391596 RepID=UPI00015594D5|nr:peroxiredoxin family protein [Pedobacter sp. BAL39]EDM37991.1 hypothetical protein PBAL39_16239 [Pedobacter sp. BAL39]